MERIDTSTGTPVSLVVVPVQAGGPRPPERPMPFTGFGLFPLLLLAVLLLLAGSVLLTAVRRPTPARARRTS